MTTAKTPSPLTTLLTTLVALLGACSTTAPAPPATPTPTAASPQPAAAQPATMPAATAQPAPASAVKTVTLPAYLDPKSEISTARSVYFDFDDAALKNEFSGLIERQGKYLASQSNLAVRIEGNCDERGSAEYNLALGQKRAQAVVGGLKIYGVRDAQMEPISWGKEKPKAPGHDESAWAQNRRADIVYPR